MSDVVSIFQNFGWPGYIALIILAAIIIFIKYLDFRKLRKSEEKTKEAISGLGDKIAEKLTETITAQNTAIVTMMSEQNNNLVNNLKETNEKLLEHAFDSAFENREKKHAESLEYRRDISPEIVNILKELRAEFKASRVSILEFHNSNINLSGLGFLSYDMKYERQEIGVPTINQLVKDRDISQLSWMMKQIGMHEKKVFFMNMNGMTKESLDKFWEDAPVLYDELIKKLNVKGMILIGLYDYNTAVMLGILSIEYHEDKIEVIKNISEDLDDYINRCAIYGSRLSQLLTLPIDENNKEKK